MPPNYYPCSSIVYLSDEIIFFNTRTRIAYVCTHVATHACMYVCVYNCIANCILLICVLCIYTE